MKKILLILLMFVAFITNGQTCFNAYTSPGNFSFNSENLLWTTASFNLPNNTPMVWEITSDTSGGARFSNGQRVITTQSIGDLNSVLVTMGPSAGIVTVRMTFPNNPKGTSCSSSGTSNIDYGVVKAIINKFIVYPNPYKSNFNLDISTNSNALMNINVYDVLGKKIESKIFKPGEAKNLQLGDGYPMGVYNVILSQGTEVKSVRIIKER